MDAMKLNINKTKYRYFMDNVKPEGTAMIYTIPVPRGEEKPTDEFFDRDYPDVKISYKKFLRMIDKTAKALIAYGVRAGDVVTVCHTNTPEIFYMDYALSKIGAIPNYIYPNITAKEMKHFIEELSSKYVFVLDEPEIKKNMKQAIEGTDIKVVSSSVIEAFPQLFKMIAKKKNPIKSIRIPNEIIWSSFIKKGKKIKTVKENPYTPNVTCSYVHSSGTSGIPKAIDISNENDNSIPHNHEIDHISFNSGKRCIQNIPLFVEYGKTSSHLIFCNTVCAIIIPEMNPKNFYDLVNKYHAEYAFTTPSHARELIKRDTDMNNVENYLFGGDGFDDVEASLIDYFKKNGSKRPPYQGYGASEFSAFDIINRPNEHRVGSIGKICGNSDYVIVQPGTTNVIKEPYIVGELCLSGIGMTKGYAGDSKNETAKVYVTHPDGKTYVHMGDYISVDEDGFFYYHGRIKNIIKRRSFAFSPAEIVTAVLKHPNVKQCVVIPRYSREEGETPSAHVTLNDYGEAEKTLAEIKRLVADNVQEFHRPTHYKIRNEIPLTKNNKNNITALKIEDTASMFDGVISADIEAHNTSEYEFLLKVLIKSDRSDEEIINKLEEHINRIAGIIKFTVGKIKYEIEKREL
ncbi:MAG: acyl--CoA ligase [Clostridia bacterium]|nr:acyl--CoA ligase [Clostridia bacterium]